MVKESHHEESHHEESHPSEHHHSHSHKPYYVRDDGYTYSREELEAFKIPHRIRMSKCVDFYVPMKQCMAKQSSFKIYFDPRKGNCEKEYHEYETCQNHHMELQQGTHVLNAFYFNQKKAREDGISNTLAQKFYKSPLAYTY